MILMNHFWVCLHLLGHFSIYDLLMLCLLGQIVASLDQGIITMKKGELALFTLSCPCGYENIAAQGVPANEVLLFEVELISWLKVVDICKDGGIIKKVLSHGDDRLVGELDQVTGTLREI